FDLGLGVVSDIVAFPHATARLELGDEARTSRLARRLAPDACLLLDPGARVEWSGGAWTAVTAAERLVPAGGRAPFAPRAA
ncbi:MAG: hypothetical protein R3266_02140, partial [Gemmatimonadota bacterium]|nr:hypothetical protein [Gemmatimonadota bacterium]